MKQKLLILFMLLNLAYPAVWAESYYLWNEQSGKFLGFSGNLTLVESNPPLCNFTGSNGVYSKIQIGTTSGSNYNLHIGSSKWSRGTSSQTTWYKVSGTTATKASALEAGAQYVVIGSNSGNKTLRAVTTTSNSDPRLDWNANITVSEDEVTGFDEYDVWTLDVIDHTKKYYIYSTGVNNYINIPSTENSNLKPNANKSKVQFTPYEGGGYSIQDVDNNMYVGNSGYYAIATAEPVKWKIAATQTEDYYTIQTAEGSNNNKYFGGQSGKSNIYNNNNSAVNLRFDEATEASSATVTYDYYLNGQKLKSIETEQTVGQPIQAPKEFAFSTNTYTSTTVAEGGNTVRVDVVENALPFERTTDETNPKWGVLYAHSNQTRYVYVEEDGKAYAKVEDDKGIPPVGGIFTPGYLWYITGNVVEGFKLHSMLFDGKTLRATAGQASIADEGIESLELIQGKVGGNTHNFNAMLGITQNTSTNIFAFDTNNGESEHFLSTRSNGLLRYYNNCDQGTTFHFAPVADFNVSVGDAGFGTLYYEYPLKVPETVNAYVATVKSENVLAFEKVTTIPAGTGVLLEGSGTHTFKGIQADNTITSVLTGCLTDTEATHNEYVLNIKNGKLGFYRYTGTNLGAHKAYYLPESPGALEFFLDFGEETTSIQKAPNESIAKSGIFDLEGRKISKAAKGIYINDGNKLIR